MPCNGYNHPPDCNCGWGGKYYPHANLFRPPFGDGFINPNARCPKCGAPCFFYRSPDNGRVYFDELGPPWPKHPCTDSAPIIPPVDLAMRCVAQSVLSDVLPVPPLSIQTGPNNNYWSWVRREIERNIEHDFRPAVAFWVLTHKPIPSAISFSDLKGSVNEETIVRIARSIIRCRTSEPTTGKTRAFYELAEAIIDIIENAPYRRKQKAEHAAKVAAMHESARIAAELKARHVAEREQRNAARRAERKAARDEKLKAAQRLAFPGAMQSALQRALPNGNLPKNIDAGTATPTAPPAK